MVRHRNFQSVIGPLTLIADFFFFFFILDLIGHFSVVQVLWFDIEIFKVGSDPQIGVYRPLKRHFILFFIFNIRFNRALINCSVLWFGIKIFKVELDP